MTLLHKVVFPLRYTQDFVVKLMVNLPRNKAQDIKISQFTYQFYFKALQLNILCNSFEKYFPQQKAIASYKQTTDGEMKFIHRHFLEKSLRNNKAIKNANQVQQSLPIQFQQQKIPHHKKISSSAKKMFPFMSKMQAKAINQIKTHPK